MKTYTKPTIEITSFRAEEDIAAASIYDYSDTGSVPVTMFGIQQSSWNSGTLGSGLPVA
jgi:hypothetical protein